MIGPKNNKPGSGGGGISKVVFQKYGLKFVASKNQLQSVLNLLEVTVESGEAVVIVGSWFLNGVDGIVSVTKYIFKNNGISTTYNSGNPILVSQLIEMASNYPDVQDISLIAASPKVQYVDLGTIATTLVAYLNATGTTYNFSDASFTYYFRVVIGGFDYLYQFKGATASRGFASYCGANPGFAGNDFFVFYSSEVAVQQMFQNFESVLQRGSLSRIGFEVLLGGWLQFKTANQGFEVRNVFTGIYSRLTALSLQLSSGGSYRSDLTTETFTNNWTHKLPNNNGTLAVTLNNATADAKGNFRARESFKKYVVFVTGQDNTGLTDPVMRHNDFTEVFEFVRISVGKFLVGGLNFETHTVTGKFMYQNCELFIDGSSQLNMFRDGALSDSVFLSGGFITIEEIPAAP